MMISRNISLLFTIVFVVVLLQPASAQFGQPSNSSDKQEFKMQKRLYIGGSLGLGISSYSTSFLIAPVVGYRLSPSFDIGARFTYAFNRYEDQYTNKKYSFNDFGLGAFGRYYLFFFRDLFLHAEYEAVNYEYIDSYQGTISDPVKERRWISAFYVGGGYRQWIGNNAFVGLTVLWNIMTDPYVTTNNPIFRIGVGVGI